MSSKSLKMLASKLIVAVLALTGTQVSGFLFPLHASCEIQWSWPDTACSDVQGKITTQIAKWNNDDCGDGEKCKYQLSSQSSTQVTAKHVTPKKEYVDDLTFTFTQTKSGAGCQVQGKSTSETWYAVLDYGTNYCNLHNLITGAGLDQVTGYSEQTSDSVCTQYSSANCNKY